MDDIRQARIDLAAAFRWAFRLGLSEGICNHFSLMVPGSADRFLVNRYGLHWSEITASSLTIVDAEGRLIEGAEAPEPSAFYIIRESIARWPKRGECCTPISPMRRR